MFETQEFHRNSIGILQESVQFHGKNAGIEKFSRVPNMPLKLRVCLVGRRNSPRQKLGDFGCYLVAV
jgi:hypothetical protein